MKLKRFVSILLLFMMLLSVAGCGQQTRTYYGKRVDIDLIRKENHIPGKKAALDWARIYVDLRGNGSTFTKEEIASELEAWGYNKKEIKYALKHID